MKDLSLHILDIAENSIRGKATQLAIEIVQSRTNDMLTINIADNGTGIPADRLETVTDPFYTTRTTRKMGLGLPLLQMNAEMADGSLTINSTEGVGTKVIVNFRLSHLNRQPLGDVAGVVVGLAASYENVNLTFNFETDKGTYQLISHDIKTILDGHPMSDPQIMEALSEMIRENLKDLEITQ